MMIAPSLSRFFTLSSLIGLNACSLFAPAPLDPIIGDTGQPLSVNMQAYDVQAYELDLEVFPNSQKISGHASTTFVALQDLQQFDIKLDDRFDVARIEINGKDPGLFTRKQGVISVSLPRTITAGKTSTVTVYYSGKPHVALRAPWAGGIVWSKTDDGKDWIATAVQGEGCDLWWPCKDHFADKPERMRMKITVPAGLGVAMNGKLAAINTLDGGRRQFDWQLNAPTSDYNISLNIGPFVRIQDQYTGVNGVNVPIEFWALPQHEQKARALIKNDLRHQIEFFETVLGPYPWGNEKMGFVETPHLGMEHQSINAYGKGYVRDSNGFDWLLQHELSHEWFGNLMTHRTLNHAWLHEGFGQYMQPAYSLYRYGDAAYKASMYNNYLKMQNCKEIVLDGNPTSEQAFNGDIYYKGGWTLHTLRWLIGEEAFWNATRELLYGTNQTAKLTYPITPRYRTTEDFIALVNQYSGQNWQWLFDVYMREADLPELISTQTASELRLQWKVPNHKPFPMPVPVQINGMTHVIKMEDGGAKIALNAGDHVIIDPEMKVLRVLPILGNCEEVKAQKK